VASGGRHVRGEDRRGRAVEQIFKSRSTLHLVASPVGARVDERARTAGQHQGLPPTSQPAGCKFHPDVRLSSTAAGRGAPLGEVGPDQVALLGLMRNVARLTSPREAELHLIAAAQKLKAPRYRADGSGSSNNTGS